MNIDWWAGPFSSALSPAVERESTKLTDSTDAVPERPDTVAAAVASETKTEKFPNSATSVNCMTDEVPSSLRLSSRLPESSCQETLLALIELGFVNESTFAAEIVDVELRMLAPAMATRTVAPMPDISRMDTSVFATAEQLVKFPILTIVPHDAAPRVSLGRRRPSNLRMDAWPPTASPTRQTQWSSLTCSSPSGPGDDAACADVTTVIASDVPSPSLTRASTRLSVAKIDTLPSDRDAIRSAEAVNGVELLAELPMMMARAATLTLRSAMVRPAMVRATISRATTPCH